MPTGAATCHRPSVVALVVVGLVTGILAGLLGVGGGIIMVPAMILLFDIEPVVAKGTSAAVIIAAAIDGHLAQPRQRQHRPASRGGDRRRPGSSRRRSAARSPTG